MATTPSENKAVFASPKEDETKARRKALAYLCFDPATESAAGEQFLADVRHGARNLSIEDCSIKPWTPHDDWVKHVQGKIGRCDLMIVLLGPETGSSKAVGHEIALAKKTNLPFFGIRLQDKEPSDCLSIGLPPNRIVAHDWGAIESAVTQLLTEGKHHKFV